MSENSHPNPSVETLRVMTGAPNLDAPIVSENGFKDIAVPSDRPLWKLPLPKLALIGIGLLPVFGLAAWFLLGGRPDSHHATTVKTEVADGKPSEPNTAALQKLQQENARLQTNAALEDQAVPHPANHHPSQREAPRASSTSPKPIPTASSSSPAASPVINYRSTPPQIQTASLPQTVSPIAGDRPNIYPSLRPSEQPATNPVEQWQQLAQLGSYGAIAAPETSLPESSVAVSRSTRVAKSTYLPAASLPMAQIAPIANTPEFSTASRITLAPAVLENSTALHRTELMKPSMNTPSTANLIPNTASSEVIGAVDSPSNLPPEAVPSVVTDTPSNPEAIAAVLSEPPILQQAEAAILQEQQVQSLVAGASSPGKLTSPVILNHPNSGNRYPIVLSEPLMDNQGKIAIPAGSQILVQVDRVSEDGLVELSATEAIVEAPEGQRELVLPQGVILIRGEDGKPLIAHQYGNSSTAIAEMDARQFALGAIRRAAELYTRSDSRVQTDRGTTVITENNPEPNILAGVLEGGTDAILDPIAQRNQQAIEQMQNRPRIPYIKAGTRIQVFVNQSMQMPM